MRNLFDYFLGSDIRSYLKDYRFNSIFIRNFRLILLMLVIPMILLIYVIYGYNNRIINQDILDNNKNMAIKVKNQMDNIVESGRLSTLKLAANVDIRTLAGYSSIDGSYKTITQIDNIQKQISYSLSTTDTIKSILIYLKKTDYVIAYNSAWTKYEKDEVRLVPLSIFNDVIKIDKTSFRNDKENLYFTSNIRTFNTLQGTVIAAAPKFVIRNIISGILQTPGSWVLVSDESNKVIIDSMGKYESGNLDEIAPGIGHANEWNGFVSLQGTRNTVSVLGSNNSGLRYVLFTPVGSYMKNSRNVESMLILFVFLSLFITLIASWMVTYKLYSPIAIIIDVLKNPQQDIKSLDESDYKKLDEMGFISNSIRYEQRQNVIIKTELENKKELLKKAQSVALQAQINPHFLNNTLESINWKALEFFGRQNDISMMLSDLSHLLRLSLDSKSHLVGVEEEIEHARLYVKIQAHRFKDKYSVEWKIDEDVLGFNTIKLSLQPLIENAISHGVKKIEWKGCIHIKCLSLDDRIQFIVEDNGRGIDGGQLEMIRQNLTDSTLSNSEHIGLMNINQRIQLAFGLEYGISIDSIPGEGTKVIMTIPKVKLSIHEPTIYLSGAES